MSDVYVTKGSDKPLLSVIAGVLVVYTACLAFGLPQAGTRIANRDHHPAERAAGDRHATAGESDRARPDEVSSPRADEVTPHPPFWMVTPFVVLLAAIAVLPLIPATEHWWESNLNRFKVASTVAVLTLLYYLILHEMPVVPHWPGHGAPVAPDPGGSNLLVTWTVLANAIFHEYVPFIMLLFSLYTISGGIRIEGDLPAHPLTNTGFLAAGGLLASFIGTTGAAMLLIRPLLETNKERRHVKHTVVMFIFVVCNCGGCLLPIGDPPLFLGYLFGVPFLWTLTLWPQWLFVNGVLISVYFVWDHFWFYPRETKLNIALDEVEIRRLRFLGLWPNALLLAGVVVSVALLDPAKAIPGTDFNSPLFLREIVQLALVGLSLLIGSRAVREANRFNYHAILEVAALFFGIFICMQAPLQILGAHGAEIGLETPMQFFWVTGGLSSILDNAPTYVVFFETAKALPANGAVTVAGVREPLLVAISLGAVFMGAMTYIGNGPNFMVKAIAEKSGIRMPSFFGYMLYSGCILLPVLVLTSWLFS